MPANQALIPHLRWLLVLMLVSVLVGCASGRAGKPATPDLSALDPAQQALDKALSANAGDFAPRSIDAARRRITVARDILYDAARQDRSPTAREKERVHQLVDAAGLDARAALVETQAKAVQVKLAELQAPSKTPKGGPAASSRAPTGGSGASGLGLSVSGERRNETGVSQ